MTPDPVQLAGLAGIDIDDIRPAPDNIRRDLGDLTDLAASIKSAGILQPLVVEDRGDHFVIIAGHRRHAAARGAGLRRLPCIVRRIRSDADTTAARVVENTQRADLAPLDEAHAYQSLLDLGWTRARIAAETGQPPSRITARLDLLALPAQAQAMVRAGDLPLTHARDLARQVKTTQRGSVTTGGRIDRCPPHFTGTHPLAAAAHVRCDLAGHSTAGRIGPTTTAACGECWEAEIRTDARRSTLTPPAPRGATP